MLTKMIVQWSHVLGAMLSLPCLILVILIYSIGFSFIRMPRKTKHSLINIFLLIALSTIFFTFGLTLNGSVFYHNLIYCQTSLALLHFAILSCLLWMLLSAISIYKSLSRSANESSSLRSANGDDDDVDLRLPDRASASHPSKGRSSVTILGHYLFGYGLSSLICASCFTININSISASGASPASGCFLPTISPSPASLAAIYGPVVLLFGLNFIVYTIVACVLTCIGTNIVSPGTGLDSVSLKSGLSYVKSEPIKADLEWTYKRQLVGQIGLFLLFTNLIASMVCLSLWKPFSFAKFVNIFPSSSQAASGVVTASLSPSSSAHLLPSSSSHIAAATAMIATSSTTSTTTVSPSVPANLTSSASSSVASSSDADQMDQLFYGLFYSLSSILLACYVIILYLIRRRDVRSLVSYWFRRCCCFGVTDDRTRRRGCCCFISCQRVPDSITILPKVDVIRSDHHRISQALLDTKLTHHNNHHGHGLSDLEVVTSKEVAHGLIYEEISTTDLSSRNHYPYKVITNISSEMLSSNNGFGPGQPLLDSMTGSTPPPPLPPAPEVFINPRLNAIAKKFFEKNRRRQQQQSGDIKMTEKNNLSESSGSVNRGYGIGGVSSTRPVPPRRDPGSASCVGLSLGVNRDMNDLVARFNKNKVLINSDQPLVYPSKAKSDIVCWSNGPSSILDKLHGRPVPPPPSSSPPPLPPLPPLPSRRDRRRSSSSKGHHHHNHQRLVNWPVTGKNESFHGNSQDDDPASGYRVKTRKTTPSSLLSPPSPSNLTRALLKSSSSIPGALEDKEKDQSEIMSICCGSEVMSTVSVPWSCSSKRTAPTIIEARDRHGVDDRCHRSHRSHRRHPSSSSSRSHHHHHHQCNRYWDVYFCDICDHSPSNSAIRTVPGQLPSLSSRAEQHSNSKVDVASIISGNGIGLGSGYPCPRKAASTVSSSGERRRRRRRRSHCKTSRTASSSSSVQGHFNPTCKHIPRSNSEYRTCSYCYSKGYSSSDT